jgi:hypothetical protein
LQMPASEYPGISGLLRDINGWRSHGLGQLLLQVLDS